MNAQVKVADAERWASALGGAALAAWGIKQLRDDRSPAGAMIAAAGASLIVHAGLTTGADTRAALAGTRGINVEHAVTMARSPDELYAFWRRLDQLPRFMTHLVSVSVLDDRRSHWVARGPGGKTFEWDAEIFNDIPNQLIAWRTLPDAEVVSAGSVRFKEAPGGRGTELHVRLQYEPPAGRLGAAFARLLGEEPSQTIQEDLRRLKQLMEAGEVPTTEGQPRGRQSILNYD